MTGLPEVNVVRVDLGEKSYPIYVGKNILENTGLYLTQMGLGPKAMIITNPTVGSLYGQRVSKSLAVNGFEVFTAEVPDGEGYKSLESAAKLYDQAFENKLDRSSVIIALGGGVIGDLAGFIAATYMRGVQFVQIPTTLLAQVDSSVGGKVAVNHPKGKNIIGAFYQPKLVLADIVTLSTLPDRELRAGMAEVIKYGVIWDPEFFAYLEQNFDAIVKLDPRAVSHVVQKSCAIKAMVVEQDETEEGVRAILNYGHTFGHAYEALTGYRKYVHGEAVAIGMVTAADTAVELGILDPGDRDQIERLITFYGLPVTYDNLDTEAVIESMGHDKKVRAGKVRYILPEEIGKVKIVSDIPHEKLSRALVNRCSK